jgi:hypothetical protein
MKKQIGRKEKIYGDSIKQETEKKRQRKEMTKTEDNESLPLSLIE